MSLAQTILRHIRRKGLGAVFTAHDFTDLGTRAARDQALSRMARSGEIRRVARGVYDIPKVHAVIGPLSPTPAAVADALARHSDADVQISGAAAANALGLSDQVPAGSSWITDGRSRRVHIGRLPIVLNHVDRRANPCIGTTAGLAISALSFLGKGNVSAADVARLATILGPVDKRRLRQASPILPGWLGVVVGQVAAQ